jgi:hypothetical protein
MIRKILGYPKNVFLKEIITNDEQDIKNPNKLL